MIRLSKLPKPQILIDKETEWLATLVGPVPPTAAEKARYRHPQVKAALVAETHGKCAYCESKLLHVHHADVEHIYPKSLDVTKTFLWENLTLACEICNQNKSNTDPLLEHIIDPYNTDPSSHLTFVGSLVFALGSVAGESTRVLLDLNRGELDERRKEYLEKIMNIVNTVYRAELPIVVRRAVYQDLVMRYTADESEYAAMIRAVVAQISGTLPVEVTD